MMHFHRDSYCNSYDVRKLLITMEELHSAFREKAKEFDHVIKMGRIYKMQFRFALDKNLKHIAVLERDIKELNSLVNIYMK